MIAEVLDLSAPREAGLAINSNHRVYEWSCNGYRVFFSASRQGNAMTIHIAAERDSRRCLRVAANEFCEYLFKEYDWCDVVIGAITDTAVVNLANKCGFVHISDALIGKESKEGKIMARFR